MVILVTTPEGGREIDEKIFTDKVGYSFSEVSEEDVLKFKREYK